MKSKTNIKKKYSRFLHGKGHICNYCDFTKGLCHSIKYIKNYAQKERNITEISIQVFACSLFTRRKI